MIDERQVPVALDLQVRWSSQCVTVTPCGDIDPLSAPVLGGALEAASERHELDVVLELQSVGFMDAACLDVIATTAARVRAAGGSFVLRSPSPMARRLLAVTDLDMLIEPAGGEAPLGAPSQADSHDHARRRPASIDAMDAVTSTGSAADQFPAEALALVATFAQVAIQCADGVSVAIVRGGRLTTVAASDETIAQMDRDQYAAGQGPCMSAAAEGEVFHVESVADDDRWPAFLECARAEGIGSILSTPLLIGARPVGSLNVYAYAPEVFVPGDQSKAAEIAVQAAAILAESQIDATEGRRADWLASALESRAVIAQAQGVIMARHGVSAETAFAAMCRASRGAGMPVRARAASIVAATNRDGLIGEVGA